MERAASWAGLALAAALSGSLAQAQVTARISVDPAGAQVDWGGGWPALSADGRFVVFSSYAPNLVPGDTNGWSDIFVRDRQTGITERVSLDSSGAQADGHSGLASISADGRFVSFMSVASNLVVGDTNGFSDVFVHDRQTGATERVSGGLAGTQADGSCGFNSISADGRYVAFESTSSNLVLGGPLPCQQIFVYDRLNGTTALVSVSSSGVLANIECWQSAISADGRFVTFFSRASTLVAGDTNGFDDVFVRDCVNGTTERVSVDASGVQGVHGGEGGSISSDGRFVAFDSSDPLVAGDTNGATDVFVRDRLSGTLERASISSAGAQANFGGSAPMISADGRFVSFVSSATNLIAGDTNGKSDLFVHDRLTGATERVNVSSAGTQANQQQNGFGALSADGRFVAFESSATNLVPGDLNAVPDVFLHDREASGFSSLCEPGTGGVIACPCQNPPFGSGKGCNNSAPTGGARLDAGGGAYVSVDSLVFTTTGELPSATSILLQGDALLATGLVYGQGIRCVGGSLKRMYTKTAVNGSITAPDLSTGDPSVSGRSALLGAPIQTGQPYFYLVYYRDPAVVGGCPAASGFNATQGRSVTWWP